MIASKIRLSKNSILLISVISILALLNSGIFSYYMAHNLLNNEIKVGSQVSEVEENWDPPKEIKAGGTYDKEVSVKNTGTVPCYVRVFAELETPDMEEAIDIDFNQADWTKKQSDGYYYYKYALASGDSTEPLFTKLKANGDLSELSLIVYEETVQTAGSASPIDAFASKQ